MADPKPEITKGQVLAAAPEAVTFAGLSAKQQAEHDKANELRKIDAEQKKGSADVLKSNYGNEDFDSNERGYTVASFGAGDAKVESDGKTSIDASADRRAKQNYEHAKKQMDKISKVLDYGQIIRDAKRDGVDVADIYTKPPYRMSAAKWDTLKDDALKTMLTEGGISTKFSDELAGLTDDQKKDYIDAVLISDPTFYAKLVAKMEGIKQDAQALEPTQKSEGRKKLDDEKANVKAEMDETVELMLDIASIPSAQRAAVKTAIESWINRGATGGTIQRQLYLEALKANVIDNPTDIVAYQKAKSDKISADNSIKELGPRITRLDSEWKALAKGGEKDQKKRELDEARRQLTAARNLLTDANTTIPLVRGKTRLTDSQLNDKANILERVYGGINGERQPDGTISGGVLEYAAKLSTQHTEIQRIEHAKKETAADREASREVADRLSAENDLLKRMDRALTESVDDLMVERHGQLVILENARLEKAIEKAVKDGDKTKEDMLKKLKDQMNTRWINLTRKKKYVNKAQMKLDAHNLAANGESGAKKVFNEMVGWDEASIKHDIQVELGFTARGVSTPITPDQVERVNKVYDERKKKLDELYGEEGNNFKAKLFKDIMLTRGLKERLGDGDILDRNDWMALANNSDFSALIDKGIEDSSAAKDAYQRLRDAGIPMAPESFHTWLLWAILGIVSFGKLGSLRRPL